MGYTLEMPGDHYENAGLAAALRDIIARQREQGREDKPWVARVEHLVPGVNNDSVERDYYVLEVVTVAGNEYVGLKVQNDDDTSPYFEAGDDFQLISIPTIMSVVFYGRGHSDAQAKPVRPVGIRPYDDHWETRVNITTVEFNFTTAKGLSQDDAKKFWEHGNNFKAEGGPKTYSFEVVYNTQMGSDPLQFAATVQSLIHGLVQESGTNVVMWNRIDIKVVPAPL